MTVNFTNFFGSNYWRNFDIWPNCAPEFREVYYAELLGYFSTLASDIILRSSAVPPLHCPQLGDVIAG